MKRSHYTVFYGPIVTASGNFIKGENFFIQYINLF